jgi:hypothetical protein
MCVVKYLTGITGSIECLFLIFKAPDNIRGQWCEDFLKNTNLL